MLRLGSVTPLQHSELVVLRTEQLRGLGLYSEELGSKPARRRRRFSCRNDAQSDASMRRGGGDATYGRPTSSLATARLPRLAKANAPRSSAC